MGGWIPPRLRGLIGPELDRISWEDLRSLVGVPEDADLEYKQALYGSNEKDAKEAAYDLAQFANAAGGLIIYGVAEDGAGQATGINGVEPSRFDFGLWIHQVIAARIRPPVVVTHRQLPGLGDRCVHLVSVAPSQLRPHAVFVGDYAMRFPVRAGTTRTWLVEADIAARYQGRFSAQADRLATLERLHAEASAEFAPVLGINESGWEKAWLVLSALPDVPGSLELRRDTATRWLEAVSARAADFPCQRRRQPSQIAIGFRRLLLGDHEQGANGPDGVAGSLHFDGSGVVVIAQSGGRQQQGLPADKCGVFDEHIVADVINGLTMLAEHAVRAGAVGPTTVTAEIRAASPRMLVLAQFRNVLGAGMLPGSRPVSMSTGTSRHVVSVEGLLPGQSDRLLGARLLVSDLWSSFGVAEPAQITSDLEVNLAGFHVDLRRQVEDWARSQGVPVSNTARP